MAQAGCIISWNICAWFNNAKLIFIRMLAFQTLDSEFLI
jgi:hypothetical protein